MSALTKTPLIKLEIVSSLGRRRVEVSKAKAKAWYSLLDAEIDSGESEGPVDAMPSVRKEAARLGGMHVLALRGYRTREGMTQQEVAEAAELLQSHLSAMENGKRSVTPKVAKRLAKVLNCKWERLVSRV